MKAPLAQRIQVIDAPILRVGWQFWHLQNRECKSRVEIGVQRSLETSSWAGIPERKWWSVRLIDDDKCETKGREDRDDEDAHTVWLCEQVTHGNANSVAVCKATLQELHGRFPGSFAGLVEALKPKPGLSMIFEVLEVDSAP